MQRCISAGPAQVRHVRPGTGRVFSPIALGRSRATTRARYTNNQDSQYASAGGYDTGVECTKFDPYDSDLVTIAADHSVRVPAPGPGYDTLPQYGECKGGGPGHRQLKPPPRHLWDVVPRQIRANDTRNQYHVSPGFFEKVAVALRCTPFKSGRIRRNLASETIRRPGTLESW